MGTDVIVLSEPPTDDSSCLIDGCEPFRIETSWGSVPLNRSLHPFSHGLAG